MSIREVIKEYVLHLYDHEITVKGRIVKYENDDDFYWEISHYWKSHKAEGFYHPSKVSAPTQEEARKLLFAYIKGFSEDVEISQNNQY